MGEGRDRSALPSWGSRLRRHPQRAIYKANQISSSLSIRLNYELCNLWDIYMNQKMCYLMKIA